MKKIILFTALAASSLLSVESASAQNVNLSVQFGQPGFYGQLDVGNFPQPQLIYREPRIVYRSPAPLPPLYLVVPPGHRKHWDKHCSRYDACGRPVYFVTENWYNTQVVPRYRDGQYREPHRDYNNGPSRGYDGRDDRDNREHGRGKDNDRGQGNGRGHDNGHGRGQHND